VIRRSENHHGEKDGPLIPIDSELLAKGQGQDRVEKAAMRGNPAQGDILAGYEDRQPIHPPSMGRRLPECEDYVSSLEVHDLL